MQNLPPPPPPPPHSKRSPSSFPSNPSKNEGVVSSTPLFENLVGGSTHPPGRKGGGVLATYKGY